MSLSDQTKAEVVAGFQRDARDTGSSEVQVALLTIYDMCKAADRGMTITGVRLLQKHGGKSGRYVADGG